MLPTFKVKKEPRVTTRWVLLTDDNMSSRCQVIPHYVDIPEQP